MAIDENGEAGTVTTASTRAAKVIKNGTGDRGRTPGGSGDSGGRGEDTIARSKSFAASTVDGSASPSLRPSARLSEVYPVSTLWKMILENEDVVKGRVYCTDEFSQSIVLQNALVHTTLASEVHIVNAAAVRSAQRIDEPDGTSGENNGGAAVPLSKPLPRIHKKVLEDRERKALRQAEESFRHINQKVRQIKKNIGRWAHAPCADASKASHDLRDFGVPVAFI
jgi:hypothetical protein